MTGLYGVAGDPVSHSLSPLIHRGWMRDHGLAADYQAFHVPAGSFADALESFMRQGVKGLNVTLPHKAEALRLAGSASDLARRIGAANTLSRTDTGWAADNTDHHGFLVALEEALERIPAGRAVVIGAGGAARAAVLALASVGVDLTVANRTPERARLMLDDLGVAAEACGLDQLNPALSGADFAVNTTSMGHEGGELDWPHGQGRLLFDLSYGKAADTILGPAGISGWRTVDGLGMLVAQAALSFRIWFSIDPDRERAMERCRTALEAAG